MMTQIVQMYDIFGVSFGISHLFSSDHSSCDGPDLEFASKSALRQEAVFFFEQRSSEDASTNAAYDGIKGTRFGLLYRQCRHRRAGSMLVS